MERSMFNRKPILAGVSCLHCAPKYNLCPCSKTDISYLFWELQAWNLEHRLLTPCRNCILGARTQYAPMLSIVRPWSLNENDVWFSLDFLLPYLKCYSLLHYFNISTIHIVFFPMVPIICLRNRQFTLGTSVRSKLKKWGLALRSLTCYGCNPVNGIIVINNHWIA
jgi:hypothetical protein